MDANGDGVLQESEVPEERRGLLRMFAARLGQDVSKGISIGTITQTISGGAPPGGPQSGQAGNNPANSTTPKQEPLVPGFGSDTQPTPVPDFGVRVESDTRVALGTSLNEATKNINPQAREEVRSLLSRYDRNHNRVLEREEWPAMPGNPGEKDVNKDGKLTLDELSAQQPRWGRGGMMPPGQFGAMAAQFGGMPNPFGGFMGGNSDRDRRDQSDEKKNADGKKADGPASYRFRTPQERLPQGLPAWFAQRDADADGQVTMAEFAEDWSDETLAEFLSYDANNDGVITPQECLSPGTAKTEPAPQPKPAESKEKPWWMQP